MRYSTWKLIYPDGTVGYGPETEANVNGTVLEASSWVDPDGTILGYVYDDIDVSLYTAYQLTEISADEALAFAQEIDADAYFLETGIIGAPA